MHDTFCNNLYKQLSSRLKGKISVMFDGDRDTIMVQVLCNGYDYRFEQNKAYYFMLRYSSEYLFKIILVDYRRQLNRMVNKKFS